MTRLAGMLGDLLASVFRRPATEPYPFRRRAGPTRLRGPVRYERSRCTGCGVCVMDCSAEALELFILDKASKRFVLRYHVDRCTFCAQCVESCRQRALWMSHTDWELATREPASLTLDYGEPEDVRQVLAHGAEAGAAEGSTA